MPLVEFLKHIALILPLGFLVAMALLRFSEGADRLRAIAEAFLYWTIVSYAATEIFGLFHAIAFLPFLLLWTALDGWLLYRLWGVRAKAVEFWRVPVGLPALILAFILCITLLIACTAAPNNWDSLTYHLPRIEHWIQNRSLGYYPTATMKQNDYGPLAEILLLQLRVISGSDFLYSLVQWIGMVCSTAIVFRITRQLGGSEAQGWLASVFVASLPIGILESTSTQNDYVVAALLACFVTLGLDAISRPKASLGLVLAAASAAALSGIVKPTGYISGFGFAVWFAFELSRGVDFRTLASRAAGVTLVLILVMGPPASRFMDAHRGMESRLSQESLNGSFGIRQTLDNLIRNGMLNFNVGIPEIDRRSNQAVEALASSLGLDTNRRQTSYGHFVGSAPPVGLYVFHEDFGPNSVHSLLLILAFLATMIRWRASNPARRIPYFIALLAGLILRAAVLRWDPWQIRYQLPLFVLAAPIFATALPARWLSRRIVNAFHLALALVALPPLLFNQSRQLVPLVPGQPFPVGWYRPSYLAQTANTRLFANNPALRQPYEDAVNAIVHARVTQVGLLLHGGDRWEYPIWRMLRDQGGFDYPVRIEHLAAEGKAEFPLGPFQPEAVFWVHSEEAPASIMVGDRQFNRAGPSDVVAVFFPAGSNFRHFRSPRVPEILEGVAWRSDGVHDDGWLAQNGLIEIRAAKAGRLVLKGMVPGGIGIDRQQIEITLQPGQPIQRQLVAGPFEIEIPVDTDQTALTFRFANSAVLPGGDGRAVGALLQSSQFKPK